ncbi:MAG TPA: TniQ family protein, partial [Ktedonobacteraceae bacterium]
MKATASAPTTSNEREGTLVSESPEGNASGNEEVAVRDGVELFCDLWDGELTETKLHGRLYYIEPIVVGDPMVESLTSYVTRLADAHSISPRTLIKNEIAPLLRKTSLYQGGRLMSGHLNTYLKQSHTLNGTTLWAADMVEVLEQLTGRHDLRFLTMLSWKHVISTQKLLRWSRAWCPMCYEQWQEMNQIVYEPLLWSLDVMSVCHIHRIPL